MGSRFAVCGAVAVLLLSPACSSEGEELAVELSGANEVCDDENACGGDGSGSGTVTINEGDGEVCYDLTLEGVSEVNASHIHEGAEGESGDPVIDITGLADDGGSGCVGADEDVLEDILDDPTRYYLNVHTADLPDGAARSQLPEIEEE